MKISKLLFDWYKINAREMPWRETRDPYKIWISEVILQQTRVNQGTSYYLDFIDKFPDIESLANANEREVMKAWEGLGYYSRARNLHFSAKYIQSELKGIFPSTRSEIIRLKGIGPYTSAAIASIAYNEACPAIDGNVKRVVSRLFGIHENIRDPKGTRAVENCMEEIFDRQNPALFNQAMMDLGAMVCVPVNPRCEECPLAGSCFALNKRMVQDLPVSYQKQKIKNRYFSFFIIYSKGCCFIRKREGNDIWRSLYEFPLLETHKIPVPGELNKYLQKLLNTSEYKLEHISVGISHVLSHQKIHANFVHISLREEGEYLLNEIFERVRIKDLQAYPFPRLISRYLENITFKDAGTHEN